MAAPPFRHGIQGAVAQTQPTGSWTPALRSASSIAAVQVAAAAADLRMFANGGRREQDN